MPNPTSTAASARRTGEAPELSGPSVKQLAETVPAGVNRKKQKRREKQAARLATEHPSQNGYIPAHLRSRPRHSAIARDRNLVGAEVDPGDQESLNSHDLPVPSLAGGADEQQTAASRKSKKKKGKAGRSDSQQTADGSSTPLSTPSVSLTNPIPPSTHPRIPSASVLKTAKSRSIWNTTTAEERENIKTFWLELGEDERRQLVKVEKDAVLKKMKEQQRHSCGCTVCGRKRTAIEEELEVLYDAYYEELEQYANTNNGFDNGPPMAPPPRLYQSTLRPPGQHDRTHGHLPPPEGRVHELPDDDEDPEGEYEDEDEDDEQYSDEEFEDEDEDEGTRAARADFFAFGNSLTVKGRLIMCLATQALLTLFFLSRWHPYSGR